MKEEINEAIKEIKESITSTINSLQTRHLPRVKRRAGKTPLLKEEVRTLNHWSLHLAGLVAKLEALEEL